MKATLIQAPEAPALAGNPGEKIYTKLLNSGLLKGSRGLEVCIDPKTEQFIIGFRTDLKNSLVKVLMESGKDPESIDQESFFIQTIQ